MKTIKATIIVFVLASMICQNAKAQLEESIITNGREVFLHRDTVARVKSFLGRYVDGTTYLAWVVSSQKKAGTFVIYRSADGVNYEIIGLKQSTPSQDNTDIGYYFIDNNPGCGQNNSYKIVHLGLDHSFFTSEKAKVTARPAFLANSTQ